MDDFIMVVARDLLFANDFFEGFKMHHEVDYESRILTDFKYLIRRDVEEDETLKQPIGYVVVVNPRLKKVYAYRRAKKDEKYTEKRLQGKWSWGIGGHIDKTDKGHPIHSSIVREIKEEIKNLDGVPKVLGYINNEDDVGKVHFGILYVLETDKKELEPNDGEIECGEFRTIEEMEKICASENVEEWSKIALRPLKQYLK